ncbi:MAG: biotin--[acetyl-CoA-carboxylase] ligase [Bacteroidales bacterium]|jgi:BirA family biotin operon repressor/biotin-[acetyl-CoA-carboxylase] ligase|nr:biotin--[acetyl-CoA-carboxylase] ligase [Bacteroidales bacterium]
MEQIPSQIVLWTDKCDSTNTEVRKLLKNYNHDIITVATNNQERGRGQRGNSWFSDTNKNLTFSIAISPDKLEIEQQFYISMLTALTAISTLKEFGLSTTIKWPNDIFIGNNKIGGILIEHDISGPYIERSIIGVGININQELFPDYLPNPASVYTETNRTVDIKDVLNRFADIFSNNILRLNQPREIIRNEYKQNLFGKDQPLRFRDNESEFTGKIIDVLPTGEIKIKDNSGHTRGYFFKEVEFIIN